MTIKNDRSNGFYRVLRLPFFPTDSEASLTPDPFSPDALLGGFLVGVENRTAELATRLAIDGVPIFDRPLGNAPLDAVASSARTATRADVEILLNAAENAPNRADAQSLESSLFDAPLFNACRRDSSRPFILGYAPFERVDFLSPLVFYGPSGSGKTRLVEGICQSRRLAAPNKTTYLLSASDFVQALNDAIRREQTELFRSLFMQASVVAIENADLLAEKASAQSEILALLDAAIKKRKLVVLTFSQLPSAIPGLTPDLEARLSGGLLVPTRLPTVETKGEIVDRVALKLGLNLSDSARELCVERLPSSVGGACAALVQAAREFSTMRSSPNRENFEAFFKRRDPAREWTLQLIVRTVAKYFSVSIVALRSKSRSKTLSVARRFVVFFARRLTDATFQEIGRQFSDRDHSTMIYAVKEIEDAFRNDEETRFHLIAVAKLLRAEEKIGL